MQRASEGVKFLGDATSIAAWVSVLAGALTDVVGLLAAIASLVWACVRLYETRTVQKWLESRKKK